MSSAHSSFSPVHNEKSNCSAQQRIEDLYSAGEVDVAIPFCDSFVFQSNDARTPLRRVRSHTCRTKLQSSFEEDGTPVYAHVTRPHCRVRAEYNRMVGASLKEASERSQLSTQ
eukprot:450662-Rhodomonas_salina.1